MNTSRRTFLVGAAATGGIIGTDARGALATVRSILDVIPDGEHARIRAGTSDHDCGPAIQAAMAAGGALVFPAGRYVVRTPIAPRPAASGRFAPGVTLLGDGAGRTVFDDRTTARALFDFDSGANRADFRAIQGVHLAGFTIEGGRSAATTAAIRLRGCYQSSIRDVHIVDRPGSGIVIPCLLGDHDGSNMIDIERVRIENCAGWGIDAAAVPGCNEISFLSLRHVAIQNCGTRTRARLPDSGGMRYKGQVLGLDQCSFTVNQNVGLFIPGEAGLAINSRLESTTFENNVGRHLLCTGVSVFRASNLQFFSSDRYRVETACEFSGNTHTVRAVTIDSVTVRAAPSNAAYTAFRFRGANLLADTCDLRAVVWDDFGHPGQTRFDGDLASMKPR